MSRYPNMSGQLGNLPIRRKRSAPWEDDGSSPHPNKILKVLQPRSFDFGEGKIQGFTNFGLPYNEQIEFASNIDAFPATECLSKRVILWTDASVREQCGAAAAVWKETRPPGNKTTTKWAALERCYPTKTKNNNAVELFGIAEAMEKAIDLLERSSANALCQQNSDPTIFENLMRTYPHQLTRSLLHDFFREVFIFTDSTNALNMISRFNIRHPNRGPLEREQLIRIFHLSCQMQKSGIHLEFHWAKGHSHLRGNQMADQLAGHWSKEMARIRYHSLGPAAKNTFNQVVSNRGAT
ncbi:uncharacterized protein N7506_007583 [Penicillium brevicompactum]|uniref:uncharacterized protein n=1 Tax=Penicillium brevicompactum TaxID=5074 RepID=UPI002541B018|nr:uncharacterized protein N7506_007583 [Penicillium brevicompactum]KAJ5333800.1 hypothetical protein N7506_007583 [Penicillium brevicompactum]